jgi:integrase
MKPRCKDRPIATLVTARCRMLGMAKRSAESYTYRLVSFEDWCGGSAMEATQEQAGAWLTYRATRGDGANALFHNRCALVFLFYRMRGMEIDPRHLPSLRQPRASHRTVPSPAQIAQLFAAMPDPLLRFFCQFLYATGLRRKEALAVRVEDLDLRDGSVLVRCGKGGRTRRSILPASMAGLLAHHRRRWSGRGLLFSADGSGEGKVFQIDRVSHALLMARRRCGIENPITSHHLRHAFATHLHERGVGLVELQHLLGHASIQTTVGYIALRDERRVDIARFGDLMAALPALAPEQQRIAFAG